MYDKACMMNMIKYLKYNIKLNKKYNYSNITIQYGRFIINLWIKRHKLYVIIDRIIV